MEITVATDKMFASNHCDQVQFIPYFFADIETSISGHFTVVCFHWFIDMIKHYFLL